MLNHRRLFALLIVIVGLVAACSDDKDTEGSPTPDEEVVFPEYALDCQDHMFLEVIVVDPWGRRPASWDLTIATEGEDAITATADDVMWEGQAGQGIVTVTAEGFYDAAVTIDYAGGIGPETVTVTVQDGEGDTHTAESFDDRVMEDGGICAVHTVYIGLDPRFWASSGAPYREGNDVSFLMDGAAMWYEVYGDLQEVQSTVTISTWWWQSDFELYRPDDHEEMTEEERTPQTIMALLEAASGIQVRVLVAQFMEDMAGGVSFLNTDTALRTKATTDGDGFEVIQQPNETPVPITGTYDATPPPYSLAERLVTTDEFGDRTFVGLGDAKLALEATIEAASYHQKAMVIDGTIAYVAGMNIKSTDWDTGDHAVFDSKRMKFQSTVEERLAVKNKLALPDVGPRKDYGVKIVGPSAQDVEAYLASRWAVGQDADHLYAEHTTPFTPAPYTGGAKGDVTIQVQATMPDPIAETSILESLLKAIGEAQDYIYIEDQYWRAPVINDAIVDAMTASPTLKLIVVTKPVSDTDGGKKYTVETDTLFRNAFPDRYLCLQLKSFDVAIPEAGSTATDVVYFVPIDTHSKITIIDDKYLSVGSCNKNNRGLLYEGELNVALLDEAMVTAIRTKIFANLLGTGFGDDAGDPMDDIFPLLDEVAKANAVEEAWWATNLPEMTDTDIVSAASSHEPSGFLYPLAFTPDYVMEVGPDAF